MLITLIFSVCIWANECYDFEPASWVVDNKQHLELALLECKDHAKYLLNQHNAKTAYCLVSKQESFTKE